MQTEQYDIQGSHCSCPAGYFKEGSVVKWANFKGLCVGRKDAGEMSSLGGSSGKLSLQIEDSCSSSCCILMIAIPLIKLVNDSIEMFILYLLFVCVNFNGFEGCHFKDFCLSQNDKNTIRCISNVFKAHRNLKCRFTEI